jgi:hypothetical protein
MLAARLERSAALRAIRGIHSRSMLRAASGQQTHSRGPAPLVDADHVLSGLDNGGHLRPGRNAKVSDRVFGDRCGDRLAAVEVDQTIVMTAPSSIAATVPVSWLRSCRACCQSMVPRLPSQRCRAPVAVHAPWREHHAAVHRCSRAEPYPQVGHLRIAQLGDQLTRPSRVPAFTDPHPGHRRRTFPGECWAPAALTARSVTLRVLSAAGMSLTRPCHATPSAVAKQ